LVSLIEIMLWKPNKNPRCTGSGGPKEGFILVGWQIPCQPAWGGAVGESG
jgi:hypothetical protein